MARPTPAPRAVVTRLAPCRNSSKMVPKSSRAMPTRPRAVAELARLGMRHVVGVDGLLPRALYEYQLELDRVLDLTDEQVRDHVGGGRLTVEQPQGR